jgi:hypothetical protein
VTRALGRLRSPNYSALQSYVGISHWELTEILDILRATGAVHLFKANPIAAVATAYAPDTIARDPSWSGPGPLLSNRPVWPRVVEALDGMPDDRLIDASSFKGR